MDALDTGSTPGKNSAHRKPGHSNGLDHAPPPADPFAALTGEDRARALEILARGGGSDDSDDGELTMLPCLGVVPSPSYFRFGDLPVPSRIGIYKTAEGAPVMVAARYDFTAPDGSPTKDVRPWSHGRRTWIDRKGEHQDRIGWHCKAPPTPRPLYGLDRLAARPDAPVMVCEGEKAADAATVLFPEFVAITSQGGSKAPGKSDWTPVAGKPVTIWPDRDPAGDAYAVQVDGLTRRAGAASVHTVQVPATWPEGWDLADAMPYGEMPARLRELLDDAQAGAAPEPAPQVTKPSAPAARGDPLVSQYENLLRQRNRSRAYSEDSDAGEDGLPPGYTLSEAGLFFREPPGPDDEKPARPQWIAGPHEVLGHARDTASSNWGTVLRWNDRAGVQHVWCVPVALAYGAGGELSAGFASQGLACATSASGKDRLKNYIARHRPPRLVTAVTATGWFRDSFVLADRTVIGPNQDEVFLQTNFGAADQAYAQAGDLEEWKSNVAAYAIGNYHLALGISATLAGPLFHLVNEPSGGLQFVGNSRSGKTTILAGAASVWGAPTPTGFLPSWRATSNGLESMCAARCDTALILDEMGQADPHDVGNAVYMICNGSGKSRADRSGGGRQPQSWRLPMLSSGEKTLGQMMQQAGLSVAAGQDVRLAVIRPEPGAENGMFQELHGEKSGAGLSDLVRSGARQYHGIAGRAFVAKLIEARRADPDGLLDRIKGDVARFLTEEHVAGTDGQGITVARRFALFAVAGELAIEYEVLPWAAGEATKAASACFRAWAAERGGDGPSEARRAVEQVRGFIERFGDSRFEMVGDAAKKEGEPGHRVVLDRVGYRQMSTYEVVTATGNVITTSEVLEYDILPNAWREVVCKGLDPKAAAHAMVATGYLIAADGSEKSRALALNVRLPGHKNSIRLYRVRASILAGDLC